jgi:hypothetical protein
MDRFDLYGSDWDDVTYRFASPYVPHNLNCGTVTRRRSNRRQYGLFGDNLEDVMLLFGFVIQSAGVILRTVSP